MRPVALPDTLSALWDLLDQEPEARLYAGGTDLLAKIRKGQISASSLVCIERIRELKGITEHPDHIQIGSITTHTDLLESRTIRFHFPMLVRAVESLGSPPIRNMGTIGGNLCTASPAGDTLPPLYVLDADVELCTRNSRRWLPIRDFILGPGQTRLAEKEIVTSVRIRKPPEGCIQHFEKVGHRNAMACSIASLAAMLRIDPSGIVEQATLAWGSVGPTVLLCTEASQLLVGRSLSPEALQRARAAVQGAVTPISDIRADADYRRHVAGNLLLRLFSLSDL